MCAKKTKHSAISYRAALNIAIFGSKDVGNLSSHPFPFPLLPFFLSMGHVNNPQLRKEEGGKYRCVQVRDIPTLTTRIYVLTPFSPQNKSEGKSSVQRVFQKKSLGFYIVSVQL